MTLTREQILEKDDLSMRVITVPYWGDVCIRMMNALERARVETLVNKLKPENQASVMAEVKAVVASIVVCDEKGAPIFKKDDLRALGGKNHKALEAVLREAQKDAGLDDEAAGVEDQEKNSASDPT